MKKLVQSLVVLAVGGHVGLSVADAYARGMGSHAMSSFRPSFRPSMGGGGAMFTHTNPSFGHNSGENGGMHTHVGPSFGDYSGEYGGNPGGSTHTGGHSGNGTKGDGRGKDDNGTYNGDNNGDGRTVVINPGNPNRGKGNGDGHCEGDGCGNKPPPPPPHHFHPVFGAPDIAPPSSGRGGDGGECEAGLHLTEVRQYADPIEGLAKISRETMLYVDNCNGSAVVVADALDRYAEALTKIAPRLPQELKTLPQIVASAAHNARKAPTKPAAAHVLRAAVVAIHAAVRKTIELMRASDSDATSVATRGAELVARTVASAASALMRADTL